MQGIVTVANICAMIFVIIAGGYLGFKTGWPGYKLSAGYSFSSYLNFYSIFLLGLLC